LDVYTILANQLGALLESARLEADIEQRAAQLAALAEVAQSITAALSITDVVQAVLAPRALRRVVEYDSVTVWLRDGDQLRIVAAQGFENDAERLDLRVEINDSALFAEMDRTQAPILVPEVRHDPRFAAGEFQPTQSWLGAPLVSKGRILGVLALDKLEARYYPPQAAQVLMAFASQVAVALENARLFEESQHRTQELDERSQRLALLNRASAQLSGTLQETEIYASVLSEIVTALGVTRGLIVTLAPAPTLLGQAGAPSVAAQFPAAETGLAPAALVLARVAETLMPLAVEDVSRDSLVAAGAGSAASLQARGVRSVLVVPLVSGGRAVAALQLEETSATRASPAARWNWPKHWPTKPPPPCRTHACSRRRRPRWPTAPAPKARCCAATTSWK
jgi:GAF domain-containing protein